MCCGALREGFGLGLGLGVTHINRRKNHMSRDNTNRDRERVESETSKQDATTDWGSDKRGDGEGVIGAAEVKYAR